MNKKYGVSRLKSTLASDSGMALAVVMLMSTILFLLATTVLMLSTYNSRQTQAVITRNQAMQLADAGINEYMYVLSQDPNFWYKDGGVLGPTGTEDGTWTVTPSQTPSGSVQLTAVGTLKNGQTRTVKADINFPNWSKYIVLVDEGTSSGGAYSIGAGAVFDGDVHCNTGISNSGVITGFASTVSPYHCTAGTSFAVNYPGLPRPGYTNTADKVDFSQLTKDLNDMKAAAIDASSYYPLSGSGFIGYHAVLDGPEVVLYKVSSVEKDKPRIDTSPYDNPVTLNPPNDPPLGTLTKTYLSTVAVPSDGVFFFDDDVWVTGDYSVGVTIASNKTIWCPGDIVPTVDGQPATCGLVAEKDILFPYWYESMPQDQIVQAALLSQTGGVGPDNDTALTKWAKTRRGSGTVANPYYYTWDSSSYAQSTWPTKNSVTIKGARAMAYMLGFSSGYDIRNFDKDPVLKNNPPPRYPKLPGKGLQVVTWSDQ